MQEHPIKPERITKPIQLLGAWLVGLFLVDACFLYFAAQMPNGSFESLSLVIAAIANVPVFLLAVFLLQTKFRPELQEDSYYSSYLSQKSNRLIHVRRGEQDFLEFKQRIAALEESVHPSEERSSDDGSDGALRDLLIGVNKNFQDRERIKTILAEHGVAACSSFGSDELPNHRTVAVSYRIDKKTKNRILKVASEAGFTHYSLFDKAAEDAEEDVLFGAYGPPDYELLEATGSNQSIQATAERGA